MGAEASQIRILFKKAIELRDRQNSADKMFTSGLGIPGQKFEHAKGKVKRKINSNQSSDMHGEHPKSPVSSPAPT